MSSQAHLRLGVTLPEIIVVLVVIGVLTAIAAPAMWRWNSVARARSSLDQISGELYRARMLAVESGHAVTVTLHSDGGCIRSTRTRARNQGSDPAAAVGVLLDVGACLRHTGDSILTFNARGMLHPPTRSIYPIGNPTADSMLISIAGRVRRNY